MRPATWLDSVRQIAVIIFWSLQRSWIRPGIGRNVSCAVGDFAQHFFQGDVVHAKHRQYACMYPCFACNYWRYLMFAHLATTVWSRVRTPCIHNVKLNVRKLRVCEWFVQKASRQQCILDTMPPITFWRSSCLALSSIAIISFRLVVVWNLQSKVM